MPSTADTILDAYIECALWSSTDDNGDPMDAEYGTDDLSPEAFASMQKDVDAFLALLAEEGIDWQTAMSADQFGHDFWLTRNGHGAGFWDRGLGNLGDVLTSWAKSYGPSDLYIGDDGMVYVS